MTSINRRSILTAVVGALPLLRATSAAAAQAPAPRLRFEIIRDKRSGFRWHLKNANGRIIADSSEGYKTKAACRDSIELVRQGAAEAPIEDMTLAPR